MPPPGVSSPPPPEVSSEVGTPPYLGFLNVKTLPYSQNSKRHISAVLQCKKKVPVRKQWAVSLSSEHFCPTKISHGPHFMSSGGLKTLLYLEESVPLQNEGTQIWLMGRTGSHIKDSVGPQEPKITIFWVKPSPCGPRVRESSVSVSVGNGKHQSGHSATVTL